MKRIALLTLSLLSFATMSGVNEASAAPRAKIKPSERKPSATKAGASKATKAPKFAIKGGVLKLASRSQVFQNRSAPTEVQADLSAALSGIAHDDLPEIEVTLTPGESKEFMERVDNSVDQGYSRSSAAGPTIATWSGMATLTRLRYEAKDGKYRVEGGNVVVTLAKPKPLWMSDITN